MSESLAEGLSIGLVVGYLLGAFYAIQMYQLIQTIRSISKAK